MPVVLMLTGELIPPLIRGKDETVIEVPMLCRTQYVNYILRNPDPKFCIC